MSRNIREWPYSGGATAPHIELYLCSKIFLQQLDSLIRSKLEEFQTRSEGKERLSEEHVWYDRDVQANIQAIQIFSCMAIEAAVNFYGTIRLGEDIFERNYERLRLVKKFEILVATCEGIVFEDKPEILSILTTISNLRNALVHPKVEEHRMTEGKISRSVRTLQSARRANTAREVFKNMERFFDLFVEMFPESRPYFDIRFFAS